MASSKKKIVSKDDLRRLMREKQAIARTKSKKVDHPFAKYNSLDQLVCVLCNCVIKSELLWPAHLQSKSHKENVSVLKMRQDSDGVSVKRKADEDVSLLLIKRHKDKEKHGGKSLQSQMSDRNSKSGSRPGLSAAQQTHSLLAQYSSSSSSSSEEEEEEEETEENRKQDKKQIVSTGQNGKAAVISGLPSDFFDNEYVPPGTSSVPEEEPKPSVLADVLPEGFFDDPKMDAKVRQVEYVDKMEEEWELFQRAMKEETHVSEAIVDEDEEQANVDRNIDEIDEQIQCWKEVNDLQNKKDEIMKTGLHEGQLEEDSDDELDETKLEEFLDWRSKKSLR